MARLFIGGMFVSAAAGCESTTTNTAADASAEAGGPTGDAGD
ncbi:MAG: hypothetical protein JWM10_1584, partial [Myxococcaceae bacterium]|nr:hypothetical protein [Myxococcaceae bacterium]